MPTLIISQSYDDALGLRKDKTIAKNHFAGREILAHTTAQNSTPRGGARIADSVATK